MDGMTALVLGAGGMLAHDLVAKAPPGVELVTHTRTQLDVTHEAAVTAAIAETRPNVILNCAAYTKVDGAETEAERAFAVNGRAPGVIGRAAAAVPAAAGGQSIRNSQSAIRNPLVVHFSTDYVFNGRSQRPYREEDATDPIGAYGASKLAGERALLQSDAHCVIIRTSWLFGCHGTSFPRTMWQRARGGKATRVVMDQRGRPTYTVDLAKAVWGVVGKRETGTGKRWDILHIANASEATWYDVARRIFEAAGVPQLVSPCTTAEYPAPARRPAYSVLDTTRYDTLTDCPLPRWEDAIDRFLGELHHE